MDSNKWTAREFLDDLWCDSIGAKYAPNKSHCLGLEELQKIQWYPKFEQLMRNRLIMGSIRYGRKKSITEKDDFTYDYILAIEKRWKDFKRTKNIELLVDLANYMMLYFIQLERQGYELIPLDNTHKKLNER